MFQNASGFIINQGTFIENGRDALHLLSQFVAQGAIHDSYAQDDAPKCHPDTRKQLLSDINEWKLAPNKKTGIMYLHGPAGAGKSCIARSACVEACPPGFLRASFFFWRGSDERNNVRKLVTTIAYQLAMQNAELSKLICAEIQRDPRIVYDAPVENQFRKLILEPCHRVVDITGGQLNGAVIIDGLDECVDNEAQISVINLLATMVHRERFPLGFFVTSRPEIHLKDVWDNEDIVPVTQFISLSNVRSTSEDIRTVLQSGFSRILNDHRFQVPFQSVPRPWPSANAIETLVEQSSGQFIYAATVLKFVSNRSRNPDAQLQFILGLQSGNSSQPLAELDALYHEIISRANDTNRTIKVLAFIFTIVDAYEGIVEKGYDWRISGTLSSIIPSNKKKLFLIVEQLLSLPSGEALFALNDLHSLIDLQQSSGDLPFSFYHKSFHDFLSAKDRSKEFYIDIQATHDEITQCCIKFLYLPKYDTTDQHVGWLHSYFVWYAHMHKSGRSEPTHILGALQRFVDGRLYLNYPHLQEALNIFGDERSQPILIDMINVLTGFEPPSAHDLRQIRSYLWTWIPDRDSQRVEFSSLKQSLIFNPLLQTYLKSHKMDLLMKRALTLHAIIPLDQLESFGLFSTVPELASFPGISELCRLSDPSLHCDEFLCKFLCGPQSSEVFRCTPDEIAQAYIDIISTTTHISSKYWNRRSYGVRRLADLLDMWTTALNNFKPAATPSLLAVLTSAVRDGNNQPYFIKTLTHMAEIRLLAWLEGLPNRPQYLINAWRKAFDEARHAGHDALNRKDGYKRYFCKNGIVCPTRTCRVMRPWRSSWEAEHVL